MAFATGCSAIPASPAIGQPHKGRRPGDGSGLRGPTSQPKWFAGTLPRTVDQTDTSFRKHGAFSSMGLGGGYRVGGERTYADACFTRDLSNQLRLRQLHGREDGRPHRVY
eukprot:scaffold37155_cov54-Phaeocystis_antarctica.AAC.1